jgi:hypothetical protein
MSEHGELSYIVPKEHAFRERLKTLRGAWANSDEINRQRLRRQIEEGAMGRGSNGDPRNDGMLEAEQQFLRETK